MAKPMKKSEREAMAKEITEGAKIAGEAFAKELTGPPLSPLKTLVGLVDDMLSVVQVVENRCMAAGGPVIKTHNEFKRDDIEAILDRLGEAEKVLPYVYDGRKGKIIETLEASCDKLHETIAELEEDLRLHVIRIDDLSSRVISGFYEDKIPQYHQGVPRHELEDYVTADEVQKLANALAQAREDLDDFEDPAVTAKRKRKPRETYLLIHEKNPPDLANAVAEYLVEGWRLVGGVATSAGTWAQAMARRE